MAKVDFCEQEMPSLSWHWRGQICFVIGTNTFDNLDKYIWRFRQIDFICLINFIRGQGWLLWAGNAFIKLSLERSRQSVFLCLIKTTTDNHWLDKVNLFQKIFFISSLFKESMDWSFCQNYLINSPKQYILTNIFVCYLISIEKII